MSLSCDELDHLCHARREQYRQHGIDGFCHREARIDCALAFDLGCPRRMGMAVGRVVPPGAVRVHRAEMPVEHFDKFEIVAAPERAIQSIYIGH